METKEIKLEIIKAEQEQNVHYMNMRKGDRQHRVYHMRNYKALEGVIILLSGFVLSLRTTAKTPP